MKEQHPDTGLRKPSCDRQLIDHVGRFKMTTTEVVQRVLLPGKSHNAISKITNRLCKSGLLAKFPLVHPLKYFVLGQRGAHLLGLGEHRSQPLGPQSLPIEYATLIYATLGSRLRLRLTTAETLELCPWLPFSLARSTHCLDQHNKVLELIRVDLGGPADHVARKCVGDLLRRRQLSPFKLLLAEQRFRLVVITGTEQKAEAVRQALDRHEWPADLLIHLSVIPKLLTLLASSSHA